MDAVRAGIGGEPEVRDDEPLGGALAILLGDSVGRHGGEHIDAGIKRRHRLVDRKIGGDLLVELLLHLHLAGPHLLPLLLGDVVQGVAVEIAFEVAAEHLVDQTAVADPVDGHLDGVGVDADERNALLTGLGQHVSLAGKPHEGAAVAHVDAEVRVLEQVFADGRRQALAQRDRIALAVLQPLDAELLVVDGQRRLVLACHGDEGREVGALRQALAELEAGSRRRRVGIHAVVGNAEAVFLAQRVIGGL